MKRWPRNMWRLVFKTRRLNCTDKYRLHQFKLWRGMGGPWVFSSFRLEDRRVPGNVGLSQISWLSLLYMSLGHLFGNVIVAVRAWVFQSCIKRLYCMMYCLNIFITPPLPRIQQISLKIWRASRKLHFLVLSRVQSALCCFTSVVENACFAKYWWA